MDENKKVCKRCNWIWNAMVDNPRTCPRCKSYEWNEPRKRPARKDHAQEDDS